MELQDIVNKIDIWQEWHDNYCYFVPKFIESAKTYESWQDWDEDLFYEFFERGGDQCVSSLRLGYFTNEEKDRIKKDWSKLAPMLKEIAESQEQPLWNVYDQIKSFIRQHTNQDRKTATNRLITSLQPNLLCTIVQEGYLMETFTLMEEVGLANVPKYDSTSWFKNSFLLLEYFKSNIKHDSAFDLCTYAWQVREYLKNQSVGYHQSMENIKKYISLLEANKNLVLTGAPGTGKTYLAKKIARTMRAKIEFVQFHPSYSYTDFVEGLRPVTNEDGQIGFKRNDGVFKIFCKEAICNEKGIKETKDEPKKLHDYYDILARRIKHGDVSELSLRNGKKINLQISPYGNIQGCPKHSKGEPYSISYNRISKLAEKCPNSALLKNIKLKGGTGSACTAVLSLLYTMREEEKQEEEELKATQESLCFEKAYSEILSLPDSRPYVFIIDEINRGELSKIFGELFYAIDPGYRGKKGKVKTQYQNLIDKKDEFADGFYVPENVYILATMNDIDRSVESMDFAMRRRFVWKEIKPEDRLDMLSEKLSPNICGKAIRVMTALNKAITNTRGLGKAYQIGPAYFLKLSEDNYNGDFSALWDLHIEVLLYDYLRGYSNTDAKVEEFKHIYFESLNEIKDTIDE